MAKRGKQNRDGEEWLQQVTSERQDYFFSWKSHKWWPIGPKRRGPKRKPAGDRVTGYISLATGVIVLVFALIAAARAGAQDEIGALFAVVVLMIPLGLVFIRAAIEHFRNSSG